MPVLNVNLLDLLQKKNLIKPEQLALVKAELAVSDLGVEEICMKHNLVSETDLVKVKSELLQVPYIDVLTASIAPEALNVLPESVALKYLVLPFVLDKETKTLSIAMADPVDLQAIEFMEKKSGMKIKPFLGEKSVLEKEIASRYAQSLSSEVTAALKESAVNKPEDKLAGSELGGGVIRRGADFPDCVDNFGVCHKSPGVRYSH